MSSDSGFCFRNTRRSIFLLERALSRRENPQPGLATPDAWSSLPAALLQDWIEDTGFVLA